MRPPDLDIAIESDCWVLKAKINTLHKTLTEGIVRYLNVRSFVVVVLTDGQRKAYVRAGAHQGIMCAVIYEIELPRGVPCQVKGFLKSLACIDR